MKKITIEFEPDEKMTRMIGFSLLKYGKPFVDWMENNLDHLYNQFIDDMEAIGEKIIRR